MKIEYESTFKHYLNHGVNLFLGSGFSVMAKNRKGKSLPTGVQLTEMLCNDLYGKPSSLSLDKLCLVLRSQNEDIDEYLFQAFKVESFDDSYKFLRNINIRFIATTNIDDLIFNIYSDFSERYINPIKPYGKSDDPRAINYLAIHGSVYNQDEYKFTSLETATAFSKETNLWNFLQYELTARPSIFIGYGFNDNGLLQVLADASTFDTPHKKWLITNTLTDEIDYYNALGVSVISGASTGDFLAYLKDMHSAKPTETYALAPLKKYICPIKDKGPSRQIKYFFSGNAPVWSDIRSGNIYRTKYYDTISEFIFSGKNVIVTGLPGTGKSTLLMQLAERLETNKIKIAIESLTCERANFFIRCLSGKEAIFFIDNCATDVSAITILLKKHNIQLIGFDREYYWDVIKSLIKESFVPVNISELADSDIAGIIQSTKRVVDTKSNKTSSMNHTTIPEIMHDIVSENSIEKICKEMNNKLRSYNETLHKIMLLISYLHFCRTTTTTDVLYFFLSGEIATPRDIYDKIDALNSFVKDYSVVVDIGQDCYMARSNLMAEKIIQTVDKAILKNFLLEFFGKVSPNAIYRYDIFKMHAYDSDLFVRAFNDLRDGYDFYKQLYTIDNTEFLRQQCAIYLSKKRDFNGAFREIEEAMRMSKYRNYSIRNSHAVILYRANICKDIGREDVKECLLESIKILRDCYKSDRRKTFHAIYLSRFSRELFDIYKDDDTVIECMQVAYEWLSQEVEAPGCNRNTRLEYLELAKQIANI